MQCVIFQNSLLDKPDYFFVHIDNWIWYVIYDNI